MPNSLARTDTRGNVLRRELGNKRIQVFDNDGNFKTQYTDIGAPWTVCISPGAHQYLYSSNSNSPDSMENGEIYKMDLDGKVLGKFGTAGKQIKEFGTVDRMATAAIPTHSMLVNSPIGEFKSSLFIHHSELKS